MNTDESDGCGIIFDDIIRVSELLNTEDVQLAVFAAFHSWRLVHSAGTAARYLMGTTQMIKLFI
jgi:hypothetical protein